MKAAAARDNFAPNAMQDLNLASESMKSEYLDRDIEVTLARAWLDHRDLKARNRLVQSHMRLASKMAAAMVNCDIPMNELIQEAALGLIKASDKYDPESGWRFATYARWWIKAALQDFAMRDGSTVRFKSSATNRTAFFSLGKIEATAERNLRKNGGPITPMKLLEETARLMNIDIERLIDIKKHMPKVSSLNEVVAKNGDEMGEKMDLLMCESATPEEIVIEESSQAFATNAIAEAMSALTERERIIIQKRTMALEPLTLDQLSGEFGVTRERVRQVEVCALEKLRKRLSSLGLKSPSILAPA